MGQPECGFLPDVCDKAKVKKSCDAGGAAAVDAPLLSRFRTLEIRRKAIRCNKKPPMERLSGFRTVGSFDDFLIEGVQPVFAAFVHPLLVGYALRHRRSARSPAARRMNAGLSLGLQLTNSRFAALQ